MSSLPEFMLAEGIRPDERHRTIPVRDAPEAFSAEVHRRFWRKVDDTSPTGCWLWSGARTQFGHGHLRIEDEGVQIATRVSWRMHRGPIPLDLCVLHTCDTPACVNPEHLYLGTPQQNVIDRDLARRGRARLSLTQARAIREAFAGAGTSMADLAEVYGVSATAVRSVLIGKTYSRAGGPIIDVETGRLVGGEPARHVSDEDVRAIREARASGDTVQGIASRYGASRSLVSMLARGQCRRAAGGPITGRPYRKRFSGAEVRSIRERCAAGVPQLEFIEQYAVAASAISNIVRGRTYAEAGGPIKGVDYDA